MDNNRTGLHERPAPRKRPTSAAKSSRGKSADRVVQGTRREICLEIARKWSILQQLFNVGSDASL